MQEDYSKEVKQAIAETLGLDMKDIKEDASFNEDLGADSLDVVELIMGFESKFNISIPDEDAVTLTTVQQAIDYVNERSLKS